jgi:hypothetical protein
MIYPLAVFLTVSLSICCGASNLASQTVASAIDSRQLIGEWQGEARAPRGSAPLSMTIKQVEGDTVSGSMWIKGDAPYHNRDLALTGSIKGNIFTGSYPTMPGQPLISFEWTISDDAKTLTGWAQGLVRSEVTLKKRK